MKRIIAVMALLVILACAAEATIQVGQVNITPEIAYTADGLLGWCNGSDTVKNNVVFNYTWYKNGVSQSSGYLSDAVWKSSEDSTSVGYVGDYSEPITDPDNWHDSSNTTISKCESNESYYGLEGCYFYSNFTVNLTDKVTHMYVYRGYYKDPGDTLRHYWQCWDPDVSAWISFGTNYLTYQSGVGYFTTAMRDRCITDGLIQARQYIYMQTADGSYVSFGDIGIIYNNRTLSANNAWQNVANVSSSSTSKWDNWTLSCSAYNGTAYSAWTNASINISNTNATVSSVALSSIYLGETTSSSWSFSDADSDSDTSYYKWYLNGALQTSGQYSASYPTYLSYADVGDNVTISVLANDGADNSTVWVNGSVLVSNVTVNMSIKGYQDQLNQTIARNGTATFELELSQSYSVNLNYTITSDGETMSTSVRDIGFNESTFNLTTTKTILIYLNATNVTGSDSFNVTITRGWDNVQFNYSINLTVTNRSVVLTFNRTTTWTAAIYSDETSTYVVNLSNTGNYNGTNCTITASDTLNSYLTQNLFNITSLTSQYFLLSVVNPAVGVYSGIITSTCVNGTDDGRQVTGVNSIPYLIVSTSRPVTGGGGGGGGGDTIILTGKRDCNIEISPSRLSFADLEVFTDITITNNDNLSYGPDYSFEETTGSINERFTITSIPTTSPGTSGKVGLQYNPANPLVAGDTQLTFTSANCNDIIIEIDVNEEVYGISTFLNIFGSGKSLKEILFEPLLEDSLGDKTKYLTVGSLFAVIILAWGLMLNKRFRPDQKNYPVKLVIWSIFTFLISLLSTVFLTVGIRAIW